MSTSAPSWWIRPPWVANYAIAILSVAVAVVAGLALERLAGISLSASLFLCVILFVAWASGTGPALLATMLTVSAFDYFFLKPEYSFALGFKDMPQLLFFTFAALFVVSFSVAQRRAAGSLRSVRDEQQLTVRELQKLNEALRVENAERRRAEQRARRAELELQATIDTIPALAARHRADGVIDFVNQTWRNYTGLSQSSWKDRGSVVTHPDDLARVESAWLAHLKTGEAFETEQRLRRADGEYRWHFVRRVPLRDDNGDVIAWYGAGSDIEDRKRAETALRESEAQLAEARRELQLMIDSIPAFVATYEPDGSRSFVNQQWQNFTGLSLRQVTGEGGRTSVHFHPDDVEPVQNAWHDSLASGEPLQIDVRVRGADGKYRWHTQRRVPRRDESGSIVKWYSVGSDIEDQKIAENALRHSEAQLAAAKRELQLTIDTIPAMVSTYGPDGAARNFVNQTWLNYVGLTLQEAAGEAGTNLFHPDDEAERAAWRASLASGKPLLAEARIRSADGEYRWHTIRRVPLRDESGAITKWYSVGFDIEDRKRAESALQRSEAYAAEAQKLSLTGSIAWDIASDDHFWSDEAYQIMGFDRSVKPSIDLIMTRVHPDDRALLQNEVRRAAQGAPDHDYEQRLVMPDGQIKHLHVRAHRVKYESGREEVVGALMDITKARKSQEALDAAQTALAHASRVATLGEISATIAHEVNQPLAAIVANGQACLRFLRRETPDLDDVRGTVEWIVKDGNRAGEVIRRVRGLMKKADTRKAPLDVNDTINEVSALLQRELAAQDVTLRLELAPAMPLAIADRVQLQQVIINLVMNGVEAMQGTTGLPRVLVIRSSEDNAHRVVVAVQDSGAGISAETKEHLFDAFFSTKPSGLGMGLSICRSIIEDHGGRLWASDNGGSGATFQFTLPSQRESAT
jgi:PAS domain S-box-containing protein